jgi:hypothetical protein
MTRWRRISTWDGVCKEVAAQRGHRRDGEGKAAAGGDRGAVCSGLPPWIGIVPSAWLSVERRGLGGGEGWVAADLHLGGGEWWREEARWGG